MSGQERPGEGAAVSGPAVQEDGLRIKHLANKGLRMITGRPFPLQASLLRKGWAPSRAHIARCGRSVS